MWFKYVVKVVCLLRLFNLTLIFPSPGCPLKRAWENGLVAHPTPLQDPIMLRRFVLSPRDGRDPLLILLKIELFCRSITLQHIVYLLLLSLCARFKVYAVEIFNLGFL